MYVTAQPDKGRTPEEKEDMARRYTPGDQVLPKVATRQRTEEERRADEEERRLVEEVRQISLQEATGASSGNDSDAARRRRARERGEARRAATRRSEDGRPRQIEHQSSLRSLIGSADMSERDIEHEIEDFARQIQEEGLLEGLDLDNIDLTRDDELSRRITDAYRRRQRDRTRQDRTRRSNTGGRSGSHRPSSSSADAPRASSSRSSSRQRHVHSRSTSASGRPADRERRSEDRSRPPPSMSANLDVRDAVAPRTRRRTRSSGRSSTVPTPAALLSSADVRPAARSQTDLPLHTTTSDGNTDPLRPSSAQLQGGRRSSSTPNVPVTNPPPQPQAQQPLELPAASNQSFANRMPREATAGLRDRSPSDPTKNRSGTPPERESRRRELSVPSAHSPADLAVVHSATSRPSSRSPTGSVSGHGHQRTRSQLFPEPSITCTRCRKTHIEYELHYNCYVCNDGQWNICLDCYRAGKGCQYWFGFGYAAWHKWEKLRKQHEQDGREDSNKPLAKPHMLSARRYAPPPSTPGGADGRKTLTTDDPAKRLEAGTFCARCLVWTNECYWRCNVCNDGDWGFCNDCVNQGKSCPHPLLPLTDTDEEYLLQQQLNNTPGQHPPRSPGIPSGASILTGPTASSIGPFKPLTFNTSCDVCQDRIPPLEPRYHCYACTSALVAGASPGDYDICATCYGNLVQHGEISGENGHAGWRRCLNGHRMATVGFTEGTVGHWRYVDRDLVGGAGLRQEGYDGPAGADLDKWSWETDVGAPRLERLVTRDVKATAPPGSGNTDEFPPDGGSGPRGIARWAWYPRPGVDNELLFPRGAEIVDIKLISAEWYLGSYMADRGLFPAKYIKLVEEEAD